MSLQFHNQLSRSVEPFTPLKDGVVSLYTCGPTVYNQLHVGNWAAYLYWDVLVRVLQANGFTVNRVLNITDVGHLVSDSDDGEDKLEKGARREGKTAWEVAAFYTDDFIKGLNALGLVPATHLVKASDYIQQQLTLVRTLKEKGHTYQISDGIYFDTSTFSRYDDFAGLHLDEQKAGARVEFNPEKRNASDFALWKFTPDGQTRDMEWATPADLTAEGVERPGFPGWHLECSAMALDLLGETIDIHTGGIDHIPVHHTNEIAQSESATGKPFSQFWLHNNHLKSDGTKISKSLENGYTLDDLAQKAYTPQDFRLFVLQSHYRSEGNFSFENLTAAQHRFLRWRNVAALRHQLHDTLQNPAELPDKSTLGYADAHALREILENDLDTPGALTLIDSVFDQFSASDTSAASREGLMAFLEAVDALLGVQLLHTTPDISDETKQLILERQRARETKDWSAADSLRRDIEKSGITVRDTATGPIWEYVA